jgi:eukaryotic-like serine/threonine-protein kinase
VAAIELKRGDKIQDYELIEFISSGATAEVWHVKDSAGEDKALKIFSPMRGVDSGTLDTLFDEFRLTLDLDHPNILKPEKMGSFQKVPYIIMPLCHGGLQSEHTSRAIQRKRQNDGNLNLFSNQEVKSFLVEIASGLDYLHKSNIIHRDIKPENILILEEQGIKRYVLTDFGISTKLKEDLMRQTMSQQMSSGHLTPAYAAPEQFEGKVNFKSDIFSLGLILFEMAEGKLPFEGTKPAGDLLRNGERIPEMDAEIESSLKEVIYSCLRTGAKQRPDAQQLIGMIGSRMTQPLRDTKPAIEEEHITNDNSRLTQRQPEFKDAQDPAMTLAYSEASAPRALQGKGFYDPVNGRNTAKSRRRRRTIWLSVLVILIVAANLVGFYFYKKSEDAVAIARARHEFAIGNPAEALTHYNSTWALHLTEEDEDNLAVCRKLARYDAIGPFNEGYAPIKSGTQWGFADASGNEVVECIYDDVMAFEGNQAAVIKDGKCGIINNKGDIIEELKHGFCYNYNGQWAWDN